MLGVYWILLKKVECRHLKLSVSKEIFLKVAAFHFLGLTVWFQLYIEIDIKVILHYTITIESHNPSSNARH